MSGKPIKRVEIPRSGKKMNNGKVQGPKSEKPPTLRELKKRKKVAATFRDRKDVATEIKRSAGGHGPDSRDPEILVNTNGTGPLVARSQISEVKIVAQCDPASVHFLAYGPVAMAIQRGWLGTDTTELGGGAAEAFYALTYLVNSFYTAMNGTFPTIQSAPVWFWETCAALMTKGGKFKTGDIQYSWLFSSFFPEAKIDFGGGYKLFFGIPGTAVTNGFPVLEAPAPYTPELGEKSVSKLFAYFNNQAMCKMVQKDKLMLEKDTSAFAAIYPEWGSSITTSGGMATTIQHEVKIQAPLFSKFANYQAPIGKFRGFQEARKGSGTSCYIIPRIMDMRADRELKNKAAPIFKFYNFDEYFLTLSYILAQASEKLANDQAQVTIPVCNLTSQQVQLLLRQTLMPRFYNAYAQDLQNWSTNGPTMFPFSTCANGNSNSQVAEMQLPFVFVENIRCATRRVIRLQENYILDTLPILARTPDIQQLGNFTFQGKDGPQLLYAPPGPELPIDLIDLSYDNKTKYITVTGRPLADLVQEWNVYIKGLGNALTTLCSLGTEPGISALITTFTTRHVSAVPVIELAPNTQPTQVAAKSMQKRSSITDLKKGNTIPMRKKVGRATPVPGESDMYQTWAPRNLTSTDPFYASLLRYTLAFVQPCTFGTEELNTEATLQFQQAFQSEPYKLNYSDLTTTIAQFDESVTIDQVCYGAATLDVKTNLSAPSEVEVELAAMAVGGRGGFFTSLAGAIGEGLGIPGAREVASLIGNVTGL